LGELYLEMARYADSIQCFEQALQRKPDSPETHYSLGLAHLKIGNTMETLQQCDLLHTLDISRENDFRQQIDHASPARKFEG
jgi:tetratricopeptide (TPR) repeat protein